MKTANRTIIALTTFIFFAFQQGLFCQAPGTSSLFPIIVPAGTQSLVNQGTTTTEKWYLFTLSNPNIYIKTSVVNQGNQYPLKVADFFVYDQTNNFIGTATDSLATDTNAHFYHSNANLTDQIYLKLSFDLTCNACNGATDFSISIIEYASQTGCPSATIPCEYVKNGGFEYFSGSCNTLGISGPGAVFPACDWQIPSACALGGILGTPDYYNSCAPNGAYIYTFFVNYQYNTYNFNPSQLPGSSGCAGMFLRAYTGVYNPTDYREYIQQDLAAPLVAGNTYTFSISALASNVSIFSQGLQVLFTNTNNCQSNLGVITAPPGETLEITPAILTNTQTWTNYTLSFVPSGNWNKIIIGNFYTNNQTGWQSNLNGAPIFYLTGTSYIYIDDVSIKGPPTILSASASPSSVCAGQSTTLTVSAPGAVSFTWSPGGTVGSSIAVSPSVSTIYTVATTNSVGCVSFGTVAVNIFIPPTISATATPPAVCLGQFVTLEASSPTGTVITWFPGAINSNTIYPYPLTSTIYTATTIDNNGCSASVTVPVNVFVVDPTFTVNIDPFFCIPKNSSTGSVTLTVSPPAQLYTYTVTIPTIPFPTQSQFTNSVVLTPTANTNYTVAVLNFDGCYTSTVVTVTKVPCLCLAVNAPTVGGVYTGNNAFAFTNYQSKLKVVSDVTLNLACATNMQLAYTEYIVYPGVKISITSTAGAVVPILGSYFHGCGEMWEGIVSPAIEAHINLDAYSIANNSFVPTLIEDAKVGLSMENSVASPPCQAGPNFYPYYLKVANTIFNKCITGIKISNSTSTVYPVPYSIFNTLFTSRNLGVQSFSNAISIWPGISSVKNSASGLSSMETPYINNTAYPPTQFTSTLYGYAGYPLTGIELVNVGYTDLTQNLPIYKGITIGGSGVPNFNCFDYQQTGIKATNSNVYVFNSVFQYGQKNSKGAGGIGISAQSLYPNKNELQVINSLGNGNSNFQCRFYELVSAVDAFDYHSIKIKKAQVYSNTNNYNQFLSPNLFGNRGFNIQTNRYFNILVEQNDLYNIKNAMMVVINNYQLGTNLFREVGQILVQNNTVNRWNNSPIPVNVNPYVNIGVYLADPINVPGTFVTFNSPLNVGVLSNTFNKVHNGVSSMNFAYTPVGIHSNTMTLLNEPQNFNLFPVQKGIFVSNHSKSAGINSNIITGPNAVWGDSLKGIMTAADMSLAIRCNTVANTARAIEFNWKQAIDYYEDNVIIGSTLPNPLTPAYGHVLDNMAMLNTPTFVVGSAGRPTNNTWQNPWPASGGYKTATFGNSTAQDAKLYIQYSPPFDPDGSGYSTLPPSPPMPLYFHTVFGGPLNLLQSNVNPAYGCRIGQGGGGNGPGQIALLEQIAGPGINNQNNPVQSGAIDKHFAYRAVKANPATIVNSATLTNFYANAQPTSLQGMVSIEENLANNNLVNAQNQINTFTPVNSVEANYKSYYQILKSWKDSTYTPNDSLNLKSLANGCPYFDGMVVYQAQSLYNAIYGDYFKFYENCNGNEQQARMIKQNAIEKKEENGLSNSSIFPNPNNGNFVLRYSGFVEKQSAEISIFDITGRLVYHENSQIEREQEINLGNTLLNGTYFIKLKLGDGTTDVHRLIINK